MHKKIERLKEIATRYPALTFDNDGYQYLSREIKEAHKDQIEEIESILKTIIQGFTRFDNFKPITEKQPIRVRVHHYWSPAFEGVGYFTFDELEKGCE